MSDQPSYGEIVKAIENAPKSWLPGLFLAAAQSCLNAKVWLPGGMGRVIAKIEAGEEPK